jgi:hypothetical protein
MSQKNPQNPLTENRKAYYCENCNYTTANKKDFHKHENTNKHKKNVTFSVTNVTNPLGNNSKQYCCGVCDENFKNRMSLSRHKKQCEKNGDLPLVSNSRLTSNQDVVLQLIQQNKELQDVLREQSKAIMDQNSKLIEMSSKSNTTLIQNNTTNNTTNHNSFNLNVFLNEQCKDAISITDFVDSLNLNVADLEATGKLGYVLGISRIFINKLKELDVFERPLHCTDYKRETVYIKNQDSWEKDNPEKTKLKNIVNRIARKNLEQLPAWQAENPDYVTLDTPENNEFMKISMSSLGGYTAEEENKQLDKIMRNVLKEVTVDKNAITEA